MVNQLPRNPPVEPPKKQDLLRPDMPNIPGVAETHPKACQEEESPRTGRFSQMATGAFVAICIAVAIVWWMKRGAQGTAENISPEQTVAAPSEPIPALPAPIAPLPNSYSEAGTVEELAKPWAAKKFVFVKPFTHDQVDAMVVRLPGGGLWAFAVQEPFGKCELEYVTNLQQLSTEYEYKAGHPMVVNPCNKTIYDPLKVGSLGGNVLVHGEIVRGNGLRPPISINVRQSGTSIIADQIE
jgi:hypothetical protein